MNKKEFGPLHPGEVLLEEYLKPEGISQNALAVRMRVPAQRISEIVQGNRSITADTAIRLAKVIGTTPEFWLGLQMDFDLETAHRKQSFNDVPESTGKTLKHQFNN
jgi:addiction module HigA family antidote